jgi:putative heme transporter
MMDPPVVAATTIEDPGRIDAAGDDLVPMWLRQVAAYGWRAIVIIALGLVLAVVAGRLATVTASIVVAVIVASTFAPFVRGLQTRFGWPRTAAAIAVSVGALLLVLIVAGLLVFAFAPYVVDVVVAIQTGVDQVFAWLADSGAPPEVADLLQRIFDVIRAWIATGVADVVGPVASVVTVLILGGFTTFFLLVDGDRAWAQVAGRVDDWRADEITSHGRIALERVGGYLRGTFILAALHAISTFIFLVLLDVPLAEPLAVLVFVGGFIPYVGGAIATVVVLLVALAANGPTTALVLFVLIAIMNIILGDVVKPVVYGRTVSVHPAIVLIALAAGAGLYGILGLFAALPITAVIMAMTPAIIDTLAPGPGEPGPSGIVPAWLDRLAQWSWRSLVVAAIIALAWVVAVSVPLVTLPIILGVVFAATIGPAADALRRRGLGHGQAAFVVTGVSLLAIVVVLALATGSVLGSLDPIFGTAADGAAGSGLGEFGTAIVAIVGALRSGLVGQVAGFVEAAAALVTILILSLLLTFYFVRDGARWWHSVTTRLRGDRAERFALVGTRAAHVLNGYMVATGAISLFGAATQWLIMVILGLPLALPLAVLAFFGGFIPYIGSAVTTLLAFLVAVQVGTTADVAIMGVYTVVFNIVQGNFVAPIVYGRSVSLHPAIVLLAIPAGAEVAGIIGMFLVVPFLGLVAATGMTLLHAFDPEDVIVVSTASSASAGVSPGEATAPT